MKKQYKRYGRLLYCYDPNTDFTVRVFKDDSEITTFNFKLSDWSDESEYKDCTKKEFKTALSATIKELREVTK